MKVALISTHNERCGIAEYAGNLVEFANIDPPGVEFKLIDAHQGWDACCVASRGCDIAHINYEPGIFPWLGMPQALHLRNENLKTVVTLHTSMDSGNKSIWTDCFDKIVVHEHCTDLAVAKNFVHISQGIRPVKKPTNIRNGYIASVGFPFSWKRFPAVAALAKKVGKRCLLIMPESSHVDVEAVKVQCLAVNPECEFITDWLTQDEILKILSQCDATVFPYDTQNYGMSGAVRLGIGAMRPVVVSQCRQFKDLEQYNGDGIYFATGDLDVALEEALTKGRAPYSCLKAQSWLVTAGMYVDLYKGLLAS